MRDVDLYLLYTFRIFLEVGSLAEAATKLGRSEPAISARLHRLEESLGAELLQLVGRRLVPTPLGLELYSSSLSLLNGVQNLLELVAGASEEPVGVLRVGVLPTVGIYTVAPLLPEFLARHPRVNIQLRYGLTEAHLEDLADGTLDAVMSVGEPPSDPRLTVIGVREVRPVLVGPRSRLDQLSPDPARLADETLVVWGPMEDPFFNGVSDFLRAAGLAQNIRVEVGHIQTIKTLISHGAGVAVLPDYTVTEPDLATIALRGLDSRFVMWCAARTAALSGLALSRFVQCVTEPGP